MGEDPLAEAWRSRVAGLFLAAVRLHARHGRPDRPPELTIIYSADLRGALAAPPRDAGGLARRATLVDRARLTARALVQVDAGDVGRRPRTIPPWLSRRGGRRGHVSPCARSAARAAAGRPRHVAVSKAILF
jgi:hypothetical protein